MRMWNAHPTSRPSCLYGPVPTELSHGFHIFIERGPRWDLRAVRSRWAEG